MNTSNRKYIQVGVLRMEKVSQVIYYLRSNSPNGRNVVEISKLIYYSDGAYYQRNAKTITGETYIHTDTCPQILNFNYAALYLIENKHIEVRPRFKTDTFCGFSLFAAKEMPTTKISKQEKRIIQKVLSAFKGGLVDENLHYPNLYENYIITPLYSEIKFSTSSLGTKIHFLKKKSLLRLSDKIFRVIFD